MACWLFRAIDVQANAKMFLTLTKDMFCDLWFNIQISFHAYVFKNVTHHTLYLIFV